LFLKISKFCAALQYTSEVNHNGFTSSSTGCDLKTGQSSNFCKEQYVTERSTSNIRKIEKPYTPFSYRRTAVEAFDRLFAQYQKSIIVLSYSSNGYPDRDELVHLLRKYKSQITVHERAHRYHFGTHQAVERATVQEYLIVGQ
jgi:adenine-specific DNA methylase